MRLLLALFPIVGFVSRADGCASTGGSVVTTTSASTSCSACTAGQVALSVENPNDANSHAPTSALGPTQNGCLTLVVTCTPINNNAQSLLTFQNGLGGPVAGNPSTATLVCNTQGQWVYTNAGISTVITTAYCLG